MQLLRDNLTLWTSSDSVEAEAAPAAETKETEKAPEQDAKEAEVPAETAPVAES